MALSVATIKATIISALNAEYGPPDDPATQDKLATALANAVYTVLTAQSSVVIPGGSSAGTYPIT